MNNILIIPAEGDSVETEKWYAEDVAKHYPSAEVYIFPLEKYYRLSRKHFTISSVSLGATERCSLRICVRESIRAFFEKHEDLSDLEIHAQGGFGAYVAYQMTLICWQRIKRIFFIGGAPSKAMMWHQRFFHRHLSRFWYFTGIPFFADDPNPRNDPKIAAIKASSTLAMRRDPKLYRDQLVLIGTWNPNPKYSVSYPIRAYFVPNGYSVRPAWLDNSYDNLKAALLWDDYGVKTLSCPGQNFSFYSLMPSGALFAVLDRARADESELDLHLKGRP